MHELHVHPTFPDPRGKILLHNIITAFDRFGSDRLLVGGAAAAAAAASLWPHADRVS